MGAYTPKAYIYFVCEGKSEENYLQLLNRTLRDYDSFPIFHSVPTKASQTQSGHFRDIPPRFNMAKKAHPKDAVYIWADDDLYVRNDKNNGTLLENSGELKSRYLFSIHNFEDFLMMHMPDEIYEQWLTFCRSSHHITTPLHSKEYLPKFCDFFPLYYKGCIPQEIATNMPTALANMFRHNQEGRVHGELRSELADLLEKLFARYGVNL